MVMSLDKIVNEQDRTLEGWILLNSSTVFDEHGTNFHFRPLAFWEDKVVPYLQD